MSLEFENAWHDLNLRLRDLEIGRGPRGGIARAGNAPSQQRLHRRHAARDRAPHLLPSARSGALFSRAIQSEDARSGLPGTATTAHQYAAARNWLFFVPATTSNGSSRAPSWATGSRPTAESLFPPSPTRFQFLPGHIVIASTEHRTQEWRFRDDNGLDVAELIDDLVRLADRMPGQLGFYNGVDAGIFDPGTPALPVRDAPGRREYAFPLEVAAQPPAPAAAPPPLRHTTRWTR